MILCIKCDTEKPESDFYKSGVRVGGTGECKECTKRRVRENRAANVEYYRAFDRQRANLPHRVKARKEYAETDWGKVVTAKAKAAHYRRYPHRSAARNAVNNAVRDSKLFKPMNCEECGSNSPLHGHHCDYNKPLDVMWLCETCHKLWHKENTPIYPHSETSNS